MDDFAALFVLVVLVLLAIPIGVVVLFFRTASLRDRITLLERRLAERARFGDVTASERTPDQGAVDVLADDPRIDDVPAQFRDDPVIAAEPVRGPTPWDKAVGRVATAADDVTATDTEMPARLQAAPVVLRPDWMADLFDWLRVNWIYVVSAASLGLAGIFFVQYGMERGLLPPALRVIAAIIFGSALIAAGEWIRQRHGDEGPTNTIHLPSVFSGAGLVSIFAATLAARHLYGLIGPEMAFAGHLFTAALAVALGWFYGPLLAAVGLIGAALSPFVVGGGSDAAPWLYAYFALITAVGLGIDAVRRWAWVSVLALVLGYGASFLMLGAGAGETGWVVVLLAMAAMAVVIPPLALMPQHAGPFTLQTLLGQSGGRWPDFPVRLAGGAALASSLGLLMLAASRVDMPVLAPAALTVMALAYLLWARKAEALNDMALLPTLGLLLTLVVQALSRGPLFTAFERQTIAQRAPETGGPVEVSLLLAFAAAISAAAAWRALRRQDWLLDLFFGLMAVLTASLAVAILEFLWAPAPVIGTYPWALHIIGVAALMTVLATRFAAADQGDMRRTAHATLAALSLIALALFLLTTATALTLALAVLLLVAAALDWRFGLREMGLFIQIGVAVLTYRLLIDPGLDWALEGPLGAVITAFAGSIAAMVAARVLVATQARGLTVAVLESAAAALAAIFANVLITRWLIPQVQAGGEVSHWQMTLSALPWLVLMLTQFYRVGASDTLRRLRYGLAAVAGVIAAVFLLGAVVPYNPLFAFSPYEPHGLVQGPPIIDTLFLAYAVPGLMLLLARMRMPHLDARLLAGLLGLGAALVALYAGLEIRRLWQGDWLGAPDVKQGELYTYTLALMLLGAALLFEAIRKGSVLLRRIAMGVIGLVIAKVFLIDAAGLTGLTRVFSFLGLGLSLAGLAWLNRWAEQATGKDS